MGGRGKKSGGGAAAGGGATGVASATGASGAGATGAAAGGQQAQQPPQQAKQAPQPQQATQGGKPTINATTMSDAEYMRQYNAQAPRYTQRQGVKDYIDPKVTSTNFAQSQNLNYKLDTGQRLTSREQRMLDSMEQLSHPIGQDTVVYRGAHKNVLENLGIQNYDTMTQAQLQQALVGTTWQTKSLSSTSYSKNKSPFLSGPLAGGREVVMKINVHKGTNVTMVNPPQAEVVIGRNSNWQITGVRYTGRTANPRANYRAGGWPVVELEIDVWQ